MQTTFRSPVTEQEHALVRAFETEAEVIMALCCQIDMKFTASTRLDDRRLRKTQRRALDAARVRYAALATAIEQTMPVSA